MRSINPHLSETKDTHQQLIWQNAKAPTAPAAVPDATGTTTDVQ